MGRLVHPDLVVAQVAAEQQGLVRYDQLLEAGIGRGGVQRRLDNGRLHRVHEGVYLVGHPVPPPRADRRAALLACGPSSALSHRSAGEDWVLVPRDPRDDRVDVTIAGRSGRSRPGVRIHRPRALDPRDVTMLRGLPITTVARTLLDLAEVVDLRLLERAFDEALTRHLTTRREIRQLLERSPGRRGAGRLARLLAGTTGPTLSRSDVEELLLALVRAARLPEPDLNVLLLGRYLVDFVWRELRLVVEVDGGDYHVARKRREQDYRRDSELRAAGWKVERFSADEIASDQQAVIARLTRALYADAA